MLAQVAHLQAQAKLRSECFMTSSDVQPVVVVDHRGIVAADATLLAMAST